MIKNETQVRAIKQKIENEILKNKGVNGIDIGHRIENGVQTDELEIRVYVTNGNELRGKIPDEIDGVKIVLIEKTFKYHS